MAFLDEVISDSKSDNTCAKPLRAQEPYGAKLGVTIWSNECKNADRMKICSMAGPARIMIMFAIRKIAPLVPTSITRSNSQKQENRGKPQ